MAVTGALGINLGWMIVIGLVCGLPAFAATGLLWPAGCSAPGAA